LEQPKFSLQANLGTHLPSSLIAAQRLAGFPKETENGLREF